MSEAFSNSWVPSFLPSEARFYTLHAFEQTPCEDDGLFSELAKDDQKKYRRNIAELKEYIDAGHEYVRSFVAMLSEIRHFSEINQFLTITAWTNLAVLYDLKERERILSGDGEPRTITEALRDRKGSCDALAFIKISALELLGFSSDRFRVIKTRILLNGKSLPGGHFIPAVDYGNLTLALDDNCTPSQKVGQDWMNYPETKRIVFASVIETDSAKLKINGAEGHIWGNEYQFCPTSMLTPQNTHMFKLTWRSPKEEPLPRPHGAQTTFDLSPVLEKNDNTARTICRLLAPLLLNPSP